MTKTWEELNEIEKKRRGLLDYDSNTFYSVLFKYYRGTIMQYILWDPLFWITIVFFFAVRTYDSLLELEKENVIPDANSINVIGAFLSFILTFFVNQALGSHATCFGTAVKASGKIAELATVAGAVLPKEKASLVVRYLNAAHLVGYVVLSNDRYNRDNFFDPLNKEFQVLTENELARMDELDGKLKDPTNCWEIVTWAVQEIQEAKNAGDIDGRTAGALRNIVLAFRGTMAFQIDDASQPVITFFYFHLVSFLCCIYLPLFATYHALEASETTTRFTVSDVVSFLVVFVQCCYVIGMRWVAVKNMDSFGYDSEDVCVLTFVKTGWQASNNILNAKHPSKANEENNEENI